MRAIILTTFAVASVLFNSGISLADACDSATSGAKNKMISTISGKEEEIRASMLALKNQNTDTARQLIAAMQKALEEIASNRGKAVDSAGEEAYLQCKDKHQNLQNAIDLGVYAATGGLVALLPARTWHIDAAEIAKGNILGGRCSFARNPLGHGC